MKFTKTSDEDASLLETSLRFGKVARLDLLASLVCTCELFTIDLSDDLVKVVLCKFLGVKVEKLWGKSLISASTVVPPLMNGKARYSRKERGRRMSGRGAKSTGLGGVDGSRGLGDPFARLTKV